MKDIQKKKATSATARSLRRRSSEAEKLLWQELRAKRFNATKFRRQQPIGRYIVDFVSFEQNLIIEIDGGQHSALAEYHKDLERTKVLEDQGYRVIRFWNNDVIQNLSGVLEKIGESIR